MLDSTYLLVTVRAPKRIDCCTAPFLAQDLAARVQEGADIILDLNQTQFIDPDGAKVIIEGLKQAKEHHVSFSLKGVKPQVQVILEIAGILQHFRKK
jgi:anti-anti-sigma factor